MSGQSNDDSSTNNNNATSSQQHDEEPLAFLPSSLLRKSQRRIRHILRATKSRDSMKNSSIHSKDFVPVATEDENEEEDGDFDEDFSVQSDEAEGAHAKQAVKQDEHDQDTDDDDDDEQSPLWKLVFLLPCVMIALAVMIAVLGQPETDEVFQDSAAMMGSSQQLQDNENDKRPSTANNNYALTTPIVGLNSGKTYVLSETAAAQIEHYQQQQQHGNSLLVHLQLPLTAGHAVCRTVGHSSFATTTTWFDNTTTTTAVATRVRTPPDCTHIPLNITQTVTGFPSYYPWNYAETAPNTQLVSHDYDFLSWHLPSNILPNVVVTLPDTNWEWPNLSSLLILREPLERLLAFHPHAAQQWPAVFRSNNKNNNNSEIYMPDTSNMVKYNQDLTDWWNFAKNPYTNNPILRILLGNPADCCHAKHVQQAQALLERMTVVLDMTCLSAGFEAVADVFGLSSAPQSSMGEPVQHAPIQQRMPKPVYQYLKRKNKWDIQLYEWAAETRALVRCSNTTR